MRTIKHLNDLLQDAESDFSKELGRFEKIFYEKAVAAYEMLER